MIELYKQKKDCCGCTACANICPKKAIYMKEDEEGFLYPHIDIEKCVKCGLCKKYCAFQDGYEIQDKIDNSKVFAAKSKSDDIRMKSSSGGMFVTISDYVLKNNGVIYAVAFDEKFKAVHIRAEDKQQRDRCIGSKYSQSDMRDVFQSVKEDISNKKLTLFVGTPCQVAGLNKYLGKMKKNNLILVDIVCHGTPSPKLFKEYIEYVENRRKQKIKEYYHRPKDFNWGHNEKIVFSNNKIEINSSLSQSWKNVFYTNLALRPSCYNCQFTNVDRPSDITIADFWGIEKYAPEFVDEKGISLVIINTEKGNNLFENIKYNINFIEKEIECAKDKNPNLMYPTQEPKGRIQFWEQYRKNGIEFILKNYGKYNIKQTLKNNAKFVLRKTGILKK